MSSSSSSGKKRPREPQGSGGSGSAVRTTSKADARLTLGSLLKYMEGYEVIVELKNGHRHRGRLVSADDTMNLMLDESTDEAETEAATQANEPTRDSGETGPQQQPHPSSSSAAATSRLPSPSPLLSVTTRSIRGSQIRYVHFPDNANLEGLVRSGRERERHASQKYQKTRRKTK